MNSLLYELEDFVECELCQLAYEMPPNERVPKSLPCAHYFCSCCLKNHLNSMGIFSSITCPACKEESTVGSAGINSLNDNLAVLRILSILQKFVVRYQHGEPDADASTASRCQRCSRDPVAYVCLSCSRDESKMCGSCYLIHRQSETHSQHNVITIDSLTPRRARVYDNHNALEDGLDNTLIRDTLVGDRVIDNRSFSPSCDLDTFHTDPFPLEVINYLAPSSCWCHSHLESMQAFSFHLPADSASAQPAQTPLTSLSISSNIRSTASNGSINNSSSNKNASSFTSISQSEQPISKKTVSLVVSR
jgi:Zinc finger, C3HC4 type (RING finger)